MVFNMAKLWKTDNSQYYKDRLPLSHHRVPWTKLRMFSTRQYPKKCVIHNIHHDFYRPHCVASYIWTVQVSNPSSSVPQRILVNGNQLFVQKNLDQNTSPVSYIMTWKNEYNLVQCSMYKYAIPPSWCLSYSWHQWLQSTGRPSNTTCWTLFCTRCLSVLDSGHAQQEGHNPGEEEGKKFTEDKVNDKHTQTGENLSSSEDEVRVIPSSWTC